MENPMNTHGTDGDSVTVELPKDIRRDLIAIREKYGADSAVGRRCSNLIEQMMNLEGGSPAQQAALKRLMPLAMADLKRLLN